MTDISLSVWLPVGRANFYSVTTNDWLKNGTGPDGTQLWCSNKLRASNYVPLLQCSVLRRLLEVMPLSFGYSPTAVCELATGEPDEATRPVKLRMTLTVGASLDVADDYWVDEQRAERVRQSRLRANGRLHDAGVETVALFADEHGNYCFTATMNDDQASTTAAEDALATHVREVFGGSFFVHRRGTPPRREGSGAVRRYNGLHAVAPEERPGSPDLYKLTEPRPEEIAGPPVGALTFFQLNALVEGVCNDTLWPAVFFERYEFLKEWLSQPDTAVSKLSNIGEIIDLISTRENAVQLEGQITTLRHFLAVTSRESLQRLKWSVESVRRSLLDTMMSVLHRHSRLTQLDLAAIKRERSPELATKATEAQLRGYVMLVAAKLPLIANVEEIAKLALDHIQRHAPPAGLTKAAKDLQTQLDHWNMLLRGLVHNVKSLEKAVEQAWMERLLYEEEQSRSEQEAMAEIERSRFGRPAGRSPGRVAYDSFNLLLTALAVVFVVVTTDISDVRGDLAWWQQLARLWPVAVVAVVFYLVIPSFGFALRWNKDRRGRGDSYSYEFAFIFNEPTSPAKIKEYVARTERERVTQTAAQLMAAHEERLRAEGRGEFIPANGSNGSGGSPPPARPPLRGLSLIRLGGGRIERMSQDNTTFKLHSVIVFRAARFRYAKFEVVKEIIVSQASDPFEPIYYLRQVRIFGDSPRPLPHATIAELIGVIHYKITQPLVVEPNVSNPIDTIKNIYETPPGGTRRRGLAAVPGFLP